MLTTLRSSRSVLAWTAIVAVAILAFALMAPEAAHASTLHASHLQYALPSLLVAGVLAPEVDSLDAVPETARGAYVPKDGKFVLDFEMPDLSGLKSKNADLVGRLTKAQERAALMGDRSADEVKADLELAKKFKEDKAKAEGDFTSLKEQLLNQHKVEVEKLSGRTTKVEGKLYDVLARREAEAAITAAGGNPKVLLPHVLPFIKVSEIDDDFVAQVVDSKGKPRIADSAGTAMSISQLVETFKADEAFGVAFKPDNASGSGARNSGGQGTGGATVVIPKDADVQTYRRMKEDAEKRQVPYRVGE